MRNALRIVLLVLLPVAARPEPARAAETCGDGLDNDTDGLTDEGCQPHLIHGVIEAPLPSQVTGVVAPVSGQLTWTEPPDLAPSVAFGPGIPFVRTYLSLYNPGYNSPNATDFHAPMGYGWHHCPARQLREQLRIG